MHMKKRTLSTAAALLFMTVLSVPAFAEEYELGDGSIEVWTDTTGKQHVSQPDNGINDEEQTTPTVITQEDTAATQNTVTITAAQDQTTEVTLKHVNIDVSGIGGSAAVSTSGVGNVTIELESENTVKSGWGRGGLEKNNDGTLTITDADNDGGKLNATGGIYAAGIGGGARGNGSNITITGGEVHAWGGGSGDGDGGAGIGGGLNANGSNITISGGEVMATGGNDASGIGGSGDGNGSNITITGGRVKAVGGTHSNGQTVAYGIGGGYEHGTNIKIWGDAQLKTQDGIYCDQFKPDVSELTSKGKIECYKYGDDIEEGTPKEIIIGKHEHEAELSTVEITTLATCTEKGVMTYTCRAGNNFIVTEDIPPLKHDYGTPEVWQQTEDEHYKQCLRTTCSNIPGSIKERAAHNYETATSQVCTVCKYDRGHQHSLTLVPKKEASCTEAGHEPYYACSGCNALFKDGISAFSVSLADLTIPATGHKYDGNTCVTCGYQKPEANTNTETKTETNTSTTRSSGGSHHDSADVTDNSQKGRWVQDEKGWYFRRDDGSYPKSGWTKLKWLGKEYWYYFDENGYMKLGWLDVNDDRYYLNPVIGTNSGKMVTGWQQIDQKWYYFSTEAGAKEGSLLRNTVTPDNYRVDENGIWQQ